MQSGIEAHGLRLFSAVGIDFEQTEFNDAIRSDVQTGGFDVEEYEWARE